MREESWLPIAGYEGTYEVSDLGRIRSLDRLDRLGRLRPGVVRKLQVDRDGYLQFHTGGKPRRQLRVHRLVLMAFVGPPPVADSEALHGDGDPSNNALSNLRWGTRSENAVDAVLHGTHRNTAKTHCPKGHFYDESNTYIHPTLNSRACRECARVHSRAVHRRNKEMAA